MSWQSALACWVLRRRMRPETGKPAIDVARARALTSKRAWLPKVPPGWRLEERYGQADAPLRGEWLVPDKPSATTILYLHGGGYYFCSPATHRGLVFPLARRSGARTFSLDYRLAPETPFPAALDDALAAYRKLVADGTPPESIVIAGDSAGGGLALATLLALRDAGDLLPAGAAVFAPWTDLAATGASMKTNDGRDPMFYGKAFAPAGKLYTGDADVRNPYVSPLYGRFDGLPPLFIQVGDTEVLLDDSTRVAEKARASGVSVDLEIWPKMPHVFQILAPFVPEANQALERAAGFVRRVTMRQAETAEVS
ncbi:alpha/beta hydrolase [Caballeronia mineralivorans PML1(12)]|uniref:Alpha/beta hydrolase n=1 Tax=Caballeronia mineralivorans PML1(12) TaxID=908627 RepID=A0A0J1CQ27_9BURK|nr:alpha/beta hydrolase [Caballeronia mineralivorans]KLU22762.1 alpha/beta hydrolase [Caballeronia mineralivorans PML1(12)]